jgi:AmmeMemoRadiSam system protein B
MLIFSALVPHPPLLIPAIGKEKEEQLKKTHAALEQLKQDLFLAKPNVIIIISPHGVILEKSFMVNVQPNFSSNFAEFGDLATKKEWLGIPYLGAKIAQNETADLPIKLFSEEKLDHGASIPLYLLTEHLPDVQILPLTYSQSSAKEHLRFGEILKEVIMESEKRIAIIASGDLSHALITDSPAGYKPEGEVFDRTLVNYLETRNTVGLTQMDPELVNNAEQCTYRPLLILLGIMKNMNYTFKNLSYEAPFGVGYLVGNFIF